MEVESTGAEALPEHAETQRPPRRPSPISLARQPSAQWDSKEEGASGARRDSKESPASGTPQRRLSAAIKRKLTPAPQRNYDFFDIDDEYMRLEEEGNISERAPFPAQDETRCPVFNPNANWRLGWDGYMLVLVTFVFFVTPFEIAFVNKGEYWDGLWTMNRLVDLSFFGDMVLTFNTGYYNWRENRWYIERSQIAAHYLRFWFWLDAVSLMYWDRLPLPSQVAILRLIRLIRLVRLIRIAKAPRIIERWNRYMTLSFKMQVIIKYMFALVVTSVLRPERFLRASDRENDEKSSPTRVVGGHPAPRGVPHSPRPRRREGRPEEPGHEQLPAVVGHRMARRELQRQLGALRRLPRLGREDHARRVGLPDDGRGVAERVVQRHRRRVRRVPLRRPHEHSM